MKANTAPEAASTKTVDKPTYYPSFPWRLNDGSTTLFSRNGPPLKLLGIDSALPYYI